jgi:excisionase family DNA binding protein
VLAPLQEVVAAALRSWLNENKAHVLEPIRAVAVERPAPPPARPAVESREPKFLNTAEVAARWHVLQETVRRLVRQGRLPRMHIGGRILVPLAAIADREQKGWVPSGR